MVSFKRKKQEPTPSGRRQPAATEQRNVFSYHANRASGHQQEARQQATTDTKQKTRMPGRKEWIRNIPSLVALIVVVGCALYALSLTPNAKINFVGKEDDQSFTLRGKDAYQEGAQNILDNSLFSRTKFTVNTKGFEKEFREQFPEVADAALTLPLIGRRPIVNISTAQPALIVVNQGQSYVLDRRGMVIMKSEDLASSVRETLPVIQDQTGLPTEVGKFALPGEEVAFVTEVIAQLKAKGLTVETIVLPPRAHQIDMRIVGSPYTVKFSVDTEAREAAGTFLATRARLERDGITPAEYIDVRVDGRAYYK